MHVATLEDAVGMARAAARSNGPDGATPARAELQHRAHLDSVALFLTHWRGTMIAVALVTSGIAVAAHAWFPVSVELGWYLWVMLGYLGQAVASWQLERATTLEAAMPRWMPVLHASIALSACGWGATPWLLGAAPDALLLGAGLLNMMMLFCLVNAPGSAGMLWSAALPLGTLTAAGLARHPDLRSEAAASLVLAAVILFYGLRMQGSIRATMVQRHVADSLASELRLHQQRLLALEGERAALHEREELMRTLHDGLGSTLISSLALAERGGLQGSEVAGVLRECVDDARLVIDTLDQADHDLTTLLGALRYRWEPRLRSTGLAVEWAVSDLPPLPWMTPRLAMQVVRVVQEAMANVIKHAGARSLRVTASFESKCLRITIEDDGIGFDVLAATGSGRGLRNMQWRAAQSGGTFVAESVPGCGARLRLELPARPA